VVLWYTIGRSAFGESLGESEVGHANYCTSRLWVEPHCGLGRFCGLDLDFFLNIKNSDGATWKIPRAVFGARDEIT
jgi:hypothetical protein